MRAHLNSALLAFAAIAVAGCSAGNAAPTKATQPAPAPSTAAHAISTAVDRPQTTASAAGKLVRIAAVGDTILGNTPDVPSDPTAYLKPIRHAIRWKSNIAFGNLEGTLTTATDGKCGGSNGGDCYAFRNPPQFAKAYAKTGFTVLNDANNHSHDFGQAGLRQTVRSIHRAGMQQTGLPGEITLVKTEGLTVAMLAFAPYDNTSDLLDLPKARAMIKRADGESDLVVVYMHAGAEGPNADHVTGHEEYFDGEDRGNTEKFAHMSIKAGADLVIASGPHVMRGMQFFHHHLIAYSMGNFTNYANFGGGGDLTNSGILHVTLTASGGFVSARLVSAQLSSGGQATIGGNSVGFVRRLSKEDFGKTAARFSQQGQITPH